MDKHFYKECKITDFKINENGRKEMVVTASDETVDRYNEIMIAKGCKFKLPMPFLWAHNRKEDLPPIGRIEWVRIGRKNNNVKIGVEYAPMEFADSIQKLYEGKFLNGVSIGFIPLKDREPTKEEAKKGAKRVIEEWELLEISAVPIPANPNAVQDAYNSGELHLPEMVYKDFGFEDKSPLEAVTYNSDGEEIEIEKSEEKEKEEETEGDELPFVGPDYTKDLKTGEKIYFEKKIEEKPMENFHVCDISTKKYPKYRVEKCSRKHDGKCIDVNWGILGPKKSEVSSLRYDIKIWKESEARSHCKGEEGKFIPATKEVKVEKYKCECIKCGHKLESEKHCKDIKCPECGGEMRRVGRPGPGREYEVDMTNTLEDYKLIYNDETNQYYLKLKEQPEKDYIKIVKPSIILKDPQEQDVKLENVAKDEGIDYDKLVKEVVKELADSLRGAFRKDVLGIVDDD